jgi:hypothetical protein
MGPSGTSKSQVSRLCGEIDETDFPEPPQEGDWPYVWLDATYVKVRQGGGIVSVAVTIAIGVNNDGRREVLGMAVGCSEVGMFWTEFLRTLARRGLRCVQLVISDGSGGNGSDRGGQFHKPVPGIGTCLNNRIVVIKRKRCFETRPDCARNQGGCSGIRFHGISSSMRF